MISVFTFILLFSCFATVRLQSSITFSPVPPCVGEEVTMTCIVQAVGDDTFGLTAALISINGSATVTSNWISALSGVDTSRYTADTAGLTNNQTLVAMRLLISNYLPSDSDTTFQCSGQFPNGTLLTPIDSMSPMPPAAAPLTPIVVVSLSSLSTDCTNTLLSWSAPDSDRAIERYYVYRNSTLLAVSTDTQYTDTDQLMVITPYSYSVIANSCAGNSTGVVETVTITGYLLVDSPPLFLSYDQSTSILTVDWGLVPGSELLLLAYSLQLNYSHSQYGTTNEFANSSSFSLLSNLTLLSLLQLVTPHNFSTADGVVTNITACISIASQCTPFSGDMLCGFFNSDNPPTTTQPTISTFNILTTDATQPTQPTQPPTLPIPIIAGAVIGGAVVLFLLIIILLVIMLCLCCGKKSEEHSPTVPKQPIHIYDEINETPPAHYDYIEIDTLAIKNPSTQKPPLSTLESGDTHTYTHMNPVTSDQMVLSSPYENISS